MKTHSFPKTLGQKLALAIGLICVSVSTFAETSAADTKPKVRILASDPAALVGTSTGAFTVVRTDTTGDLSIDLEIGGTALAGIDYQALSNQVVIPSGTSAVDLVVQPLPTAATSTHDKTVILTLKQSTNYTIWSRKSGEVVLVEQLFNDLPPSVAITSPTNGAALSGSSVTITATASDSVEAITKVSFFAGDDLIGTATNAPYSVTWTNASSGHHVLFAKAVNSIGQAGLSAPVSITITNGSAFLTLTSPTDGATLTPGNIPLTAEVGGEGTVGAVRFYANGHLVGSVPAAPYSLVWSNVPPGHFVLTAVAGEKGSQIKSPNVQITVKDTPASVTITAPTNNATFGPGAGIVLAADVTLGDQPLQRVSFWVDEHLVGIATNAPYTTTWAKPSVGKHMAVARAIDTFGVVGTSSAVKFSVTNAAPTVTLTSPADHSTYTAPAEITFTADAADSDGTISRVTFWANNRLIGTATTAPFTVTWKHVPAGQYAIEAHAVDNSGTVANSAPILIVVNRK